MRENRYSGQPPAGPRWRAQLSHGVLLYLDALVSLIILLVSKGLARSAGHVEDDPHVVAPVDVEAGRQLDRFGDANLLIRRECRNVNGCQFSILRRNVIPPGTDAQACLRGLSRPLSPVRYLEFHFHLFASTRGGGCDMHTARF